MSLYLTLHCDGRAYIWPSQHVTEGDTAVRGLGISDPSPLRPAEGPWTIWTNPRATSPRDAIRNVPASLLLAQFGTPIRLLFGTVVVTGQPEESAAWIYLETLVEDITRVIHGLPPASGAALATPEWPDAVRLAAAYLSDLDPDADPLPEITDETIDRLMFTGGSEVRRESGPWLTGPQHGGRN